MDTIVVGTPRNHQEFREKFPQMEAEFLDGNAVIHSARTKRIIWDFLLEQHPERLQAYAAMDAKQLIVLGNLCLSGLLNFCSTHAFPRFLLASFCGLPGFFNRPIIEVAALEEEHKAVLQSLFAEMGTEAVFVEDRVGMVSPRVICMIINEAYYTLQEGTANKKDIDVGMRLGTNYPQGPFEWAEQIGLDQVCKLLDAMWNDTREERYKICPLLKSEMLRQRVL